MCRVLAALLFLSGIVATGCNTAPVAPPDPDPVSTFDSSAVVPQLVTTPFYRSLDIRGDIAIIGATIFEWQNGNWQARQRLPTLNDYGELYWDGAVTDGSSVLYETEYLDGAVRFRLNIWHIGDAKPVVLESGSTLGYGSPVGIESGIAASRTTVWLKDEAIGEWFEADRVGDGKWIFALLDASRVLVASVDERWRVGNSFSVYRMHNGSLVETDDRIESSLSTPVSADYHDGRLVLAGPQGAEIYEEGHGGFVRVAEWGAEPDEEGTAYGSAVSVYGDFVAVGASGYEKNMQRLGSIIYLYEKVGDEWRVVARYRTPGHSVALGSRRFLFGGPGAGSRGPDTDPVYGVSW